MPKVKTSLSILDSISQQKEGFKFGEPQRIDEKSLCVVLPILRETSLKRQYTTLPETDKISITDTGSINKMRASSVSTENVYIRSGTIFKGATQERASVRSVVIFPGKTMDIEVRCVHASRGISGGSKVTYGGITPLSVENAVYCSGFTPADQHSYWSNVTKTSNLYATTAASHGRPIETGSRLGGRSRPTVSSSIKVNSLGAVETTTSDLNNFSGFASGGNIEFGGGVLYADAFVGQDDLANNLDVFAANFDDLLSKIKLHEIQAGLALINEKGCQTIETFDTPSSWQALHKDAVKRVGSHVVNLDDTSVFAYKPEKAIEVVQKVLADDYDVKLIYQHKPSNGEPAVMISGLTSEHFVGEVVEIDNRVAHLLILRRAS